MPIKKIDLLEMFEGQILTCEFMLSKDELPEDFKKFELNLLKNYCFLREFFVDYCEKNNIEEFDF